MRETKMSVESISSTDDSTINIMSSEDEQIDITSNLGSPNSSKSYLIEDHSTEVTQRYLLILN